jgi:Glycine-zipper domain
MRLTSVVVCAIATAAFCSVQAQTPPASAPPAQKSLSATLNVAVFPSNGQSASQQSKDEGDCYNWAVQSTGADPFEAQKQAAQTQQQAAQNQQQTQQATSGAGAKGAVRGAAAGAVVGAVAGDTGKGAAIGATAGVVAGRSRARGAQEQAAQQSAQQTQAANQAAAQQTAAFKKGFAACLEGKKYTVKY